jgi:uncharacterized protein (DUF2236 family)
MAATAPVLPDEQEVLAVVPGPDSITRAIASDARTFIAAGYALMLQVAHPTVGAGVAEHSNFKEDPWGRLLRTLDFTNGLIYGDPMTAAGIGRAVHAMHKKIKGVKPDGTRYHAMEPEAYAWVHITLFDAIVRAHHRFGRRLSPEEVRRFYYEWVPLGRLLGVRERDLPADFSDFPDYFDHMVDERLEPNQTVFDVLGTMEKPMQPPVPAAMQAGFRAISPLLARGQKLATIGLMPRALQRKLGLSLTRSQKIELNAVAAASRHATPVMPGSLRAIGPSYLRARHEQIGRLAATG